MTDDQIDFSALDPIAPGNSPFTPEELIAITNRNEAAAAKDSLDALLTDWQTGNQVMARELIMQQYELAQPLAKQTGTACFLAPLLKILKQGNDAQHWLAAYANGISPRQIMTDAIASTAQMEAELAQALAIA